MVLELTWYWRRSEDLPCAGRGRWMCAEGVKRAASHRGFIVEETRVRPAAAVAEPVSVTENPYEKHGAHREKIQFGSAASHFSPSASVAKIEYRPLIGWNSFLSL